MSTTDFEADKRILTTDVNEETDLGELWPDAKMFFNKQ